MNNIKNLAKNWFQNIALLVFSLAFVLLVGEWLFPKYLNKVPFRLYGGVDNNLRVLKDGMILSSTACLFVAKKKTQKLKTFLKILNK